MHQDAVGQWGDAPALGRDGLHIAFGWRDRDCIEGDDRFTVAIPTHNRRDTVLLAARSALGQTRPPDQVLVLCDGCTDGTAEALGGLSSARLAAIELPKGIGYGYAHRDHALELGDGEAIVWLADDDLLMPDHLERIGELWDSGRYDLVQGHGVTVHPDDRLESSVQTGACRSTASG